MARKPLDHPFDAGIIQNALTATRFGKVGWRFCCAGREWFTVRDGRTIPADSYDGSALALLLDRGQIEYGPDGLMVETKG